MIIKCSSELQLPVPVWSQISKTQAKKTGDPKGWLSVRSTESKAVTQMLTRGGGVGIY